MTQKYYTGVEEVEVLWINVKMKLLKSTEHQFNMVHHYVDTWGKIKKLPR